MHGIKLLVSTLDTHTQDAVDYYMCIYNNMLTFPLHAIHFLDAAMHFLDGAMHFLDGAMYFLDGEYLFGGTF